MSKDIKNIYIAFDGDEDIKYYNLMRAWKQNHNFNFDFKDSHDKNTALDSSKEETIKRRLRERMANSEVFILLIGKNTKFLYKFLRWEIEQAIKRDLPIIAVNLNGKIGFDEKLCPAIVRDNLAVHIPFSLEIIKHSIEDWPESHKKFRHENEMGIFYYTDDKELFKYEFNL